METMIAMTIFSWVCMALFSVWVAHASATTKSQDMMIGVALCEQIMESQLALGWTAETELTKPPIVVTHIVDGAESQMSYDYKVEVEIKDILGAKSMKHVKVTVSFKDHLDQLRNVIMNTYLSWQG